MSANINYNKKKGTYSFVSHKEVAWHTLGTIVENAMTSEEAIHLANLDYEIKKDRVGLLYPDEITGKTKAKVIHNQFATYRDDTKDIFGIVSDRYEVVQNTTVFQFMDSIVGKDKAIYETAGALGNGEVVFITAKLPYHIRISGNDVIENYLVVSNGHDGKTSVNIFLTPIRVVCQNTLALGLNRSKLTINLKHTQGVNFKLEDAYKILNITSTITSETQDLLQKLSKVKVTDERVDNYFKSLVLSKDEYLQLVNDKLKIENASFISTRKKNVINDIYKYYQIGVGQEGIQGTAYGAYNAVNGYISNVKKYTNDSAKMSSLVLGGADYTFNNKALELAMKL